MSLLIIGFTVGVLLAFVAGHASLAGRFSGMRASRCHDCPRPSAVLVQIVDLETRKPRSSVLLCEACAHYARSAAAEIPSAPWSERR